jgi:D-alanyl-D-alanine carboxypeptidase
MGLRFLTAILLALSFGSNALAYGLTAKSWLVSDSDGKIVQSENIDEVRSIASITKLLTVITVLDAHQDLDQQLELSTKLRDRLPRKGQTLSRGTLIELAMVNSDNRAAQTLCEHYPGGFEACVIAMNAKLISLGMIHSRVFEPTGLDARNQSTARDLIQLVRAGRHYQPIVDAAKKTRIEIKVKKKWLIFPQTNSLVGKTQRVIVSKTGWITASGGCLAMMIATDLGDRVVVVMGSKSTRTRIPEAEFIADMRE